MNPFERLKPPPKLKDIEDAAFRRASKAASSISYAKSPVYTARRREIARINALSDAVIAAVERCLEVAKAYMSAHEFYREVVSLYYKKDEIIENYRRLRGLIRVINNLRSYYVAQIKAASDDREMAEIRREAMGRIASVLKRRGDLIEYFREMHRFARGLPSIAFDSPLVVVAGPPNAGKSSLVRAISTAEPEVAEYPFTTKTLSIGHFTIDGHVVQIMDTPGLLDRPMEERNEIEKQAILALSLVADAMIYLFDPSPFMYYPLEVQARILREIEENFKKVAIIRVVNKVDIKAVDVDSLGYPDLIEISAVTGQGMDRLMARLKEVLEPVFSGKG